LAGNRSEALKLLKEAASTAHTEELRQEAILAITGTGVRLVLELPAWHFHLSEDGSLVACNRKISAEKKERDGEEEQDMPKVVEIRQCVTGQFVVQRPGVRVLGFRPGTRQLLVEEKTENGDDKAVILWDPERGHDVARFPVDKDADLSDGVCFSP